MQLHPHQSPNGPTKADLRRARRFIVAALVLAWATQLLVTQWAYAAGPDEVADDAVTENSSAAQPLSVVVTMRAAADVGGRSATLADVCQLEWSGAEPLAADGRPVGQSLVGSGGVGRERFVVGIEQVVRVLTAARVDLGRIRLQGPDQCQVRVGRPVTTSNEAAAAASQETALLEWAGIEGQAPALVETPPPTLPAALPAARRPLPSNPPPAIADEAVDFVGLHGTLGELLRRDLAQRLRLPLEGLHLSFRREDLGWARRTDLTIEHVRPMSADDLGRVEWALTLDGREQSIRAEATATIMRTVAVQPVERGQMIRAVDVVSQRVRIDRLADRGLTVAEIVGQAAAAPIAAGEVLTAERLVPRLLVRRGQFVAVQLVRNGMDMRTLAVALDDGAFGQVVQVKSEATGELMQVTMTAPQAGTAVRIDE